MPNMVKMVTQKTAKMVKKLIEVTARRAPRLLYLIIFGESVTPQFWCCFNPVWKVSCSSEKLSTSGVTFKGVLLNSTSALAFVTSCLRTSRSSSSLQNVLQQEGRRLPLPQLCTLKDETFQIRFEENIFYNVHIVHCAESRKQRGSKRCTVC